MTAYPKILQDRFAHSMSELQRRLKLLETRTASIDSGSPVFPLPAVIDSGYTGTGNPMAYVNGSAVLTGPYQYIWPYQPVAGDAVLVVPTPPTAPGVTSYVIVGLLGPVPTWASHQVNTGQNIPNTSAVTIFSAPVAPGKYSLLMRLLYSGALAAGTPMVNINGPAIAASGGLGFKWTTNGAPAAVNAAGLAYGGLTTGPTFQTADQQFDLWGALTFTAAGTLIIGGWTSAAADVFQIVAGTFDLVPIVT